MAGLHGSPSRRGLSSRSWKISKLCVLDERTGPEVGHLCSGPSAHIHTWPRIDWWDGQRSARCAPSGLPGSKGPAGPLESVLPIFVHKTILGEREPVHRVGPLQSHDDGFLPFWNNPQIHKMKQRQCWSTERNTWKGLCQLLQKANGRPQKKGHDGTSWRRSAN